MGALASPLVQALIIAGIQYGPGFVKDMEKILANPAATVADVVAAFADLKPYSAYGIPAIVPAKA